eukprot:6169094-Amphidinium_carterae.1
MPWSCSEGTKKGEFSLHTEKRAKGKKMITHTVTFNTVAQAQCDMLCGVVLAVSYTKAGIFVIACLSHQDTISKSKSRSSTCGHMACHIQGYGNTLSFANRPVQNKLNFEQYLAWLCMLCNE